MHVQERPQGLTDLRGGLSPELHLRAADLEDIATDLVAYHARFAPLFPRSEQRAWAEVYLRGLLVAEVPRKNVEAMALRLLGAEEGAERRVRALQHFVGEGAWDDDAILAEHQRCVDETLGEADGVLIIDGSDVAKQGTHSAGVARQWCGATGKKDNCQAGVFLGYASRKGATLLDRRLYLPAAWFTEAYAERWRACLIPADTPFQTKHALAGDLVERAVRRGTLRARWAVCDEGFGDDPAFLARLDALNLLYLAEVPCATQVWPLADPATGQPRPRPQAWVPPQTASRKGPAPRRARLHPQSPPKRRVDAIAAQLPAAAWQRYRILEGSKGPLVADVAAIRAIAGRDGLPAQEIWVVLRRTVVAPDEAPVLKYYLSNAPADTPLDTLVWVSGMRWPIECCFAECKSEVGLDHYEMRFWPGWHHHMTLVLLAHHFLVRLQQRLDQREGGREQVTAGPAAPDDGLPGADDRPAAPGPDRPAPARARVAPERGRGARAAARPAAAAPARPPGRRGAVALPAPPQARGLLVAPHTPPTAACGSSPTVIDISL
ncbi:MAG: IS701 family transposase [Chloroflexi bacterium]|nr:IS701 family transposase [Chloroflexota bacterium]